MASLELYYVKCRNCHAEEYHGTDQRHASELCFTLVAKASKCPICGHNGKWEYGHGNSTLFPSKNPDAIQQE